MQKQHLHKLLLIIGCFLAAGCGEVEFKPQNPYLHGEQELSFNLPDTLRTSTFISGWEFLPQASLGKNSGLIKVLSPDKRLISLDWVVAGGDGPIEFSERVRTIHGLSVTNKLLGVTCNIAVADDGRSLSCGLTGEASGATAEVGVDVQGMRVRGIAASEQTWTTTEKGLDLALPWGDLWRLSSPGELTPLPNTSSELSAKIAFPDPQHRNFTLDWSTLQSHRGVRGLDIKTDSPHDNQALALLINSIPPVHAALPTDAEDLENAADMTLSQWLVHAEFSPNYLNELSVPEDQVFMLSYALAAYQTLYAWGALSAEEVLDREPLLDAAMSRVDTMSREIERGASLEARFREATIWTFAENNLATDRPNVRKVYRDQAVVALDDAQNELKRRVRLWRKSQMKQRPDSVAMLDLFVGGDSLAEQKEIESFVAPDTLALLRIVGRADLDWFTEVSPKWHEIQNLSWPLEQERHRWQFSQNVKNRKSDHWLIARESLLDRQFPGLFAEKQFGADPIESAAAEIETVVESYLGIQPHWREHTIKIDARLPESWGRTRARVPFAEGELFVDYDFANNQAWLAGNGLKQIYTCQFYMPTPTGAISGQFKLEPGDSPHKITIFVEPGNKYRLRVESDDLPE
ncbi:MAG: hypothetical protein IPP40_12990 [bacterium]|nr:hypothetical protein [bacterium]